MSAIFNPPKPPKPDPALLAAQKKQMDDAAAREAKLQREIDARERVRNEGTGRVLLLSGAETGVPGADPKKNLGG
jgi:hypothetical protein